MQISDAHINCPKCGSLYTNALDITMPLIDIVYYRCQECRHVWTVRTGTGDFCRDITVESRPADTAPVKASHLPPDQPGHPSKH